MNDDIHPRLLKKKTLYSVNNKRVIPIVTGCFPEDFSLIYYKYSFIKQNRLDYKDNLK